MKKKVVEVGDFVKVNTRPHGESHGIVMLKEYFTSKHYYQVRLVDGNDAWAWSKDIKLVQKANDSKAEVR